MDHNEGVSFHFNFEWVPNSRVKNVRDEIRSKLRLASGRLVISSGKLSQISLYQLVDSWQTNYEEQWDSVGSCGLENPWTILSFRCNVEPGAVATRLHGLCPGAEASNPQGFLWDIPRCLYNGGVIIPLQCGLHSNLLAQWRKILQYVVLCVKKGR